MKKRIFSILATFFLSLSFLLSHSIVCRSVAHAAEETLTSFQQEVVTAKEKHRAISGKMETVHLLLDNEKARALQTEADQLLKGLMSKRYSEVPVKEVPLKAPRSSAPAETVTKEKKGWSWPTFSLPNKYKEKDLSDGQMLYRVAVSDSKITMKEAVEIGLANSLGIRALKKKIEVANAKLVEAKRALFPTVSAGLEENGGKLGGSEDNPSGRIYRGRNYKLNVTQPIFYGGELVLTVKQAEVNLRSSKIEYRKARGEFILEAKTAYYGVVKAEYNVQYQLELYEKVNALRKRLKAEFDRKLVSQIDFLNTESQYYQVFFQAESAKNDLDSAQLILHQTLGLDDKESLPLNLRLDFIKVNPVLEEIIETALRDNLDIQVKQLALESAGYGLKVYKAKKLPRVDLRGSLGVLGEVFKDTEQLEEGNADLDLEKEWFLGVTTSMPIGPNSIEYNQIKHKYGPTVLALHGSEDWSRKLTFNLFDKLSDITDEKSAQAALLQAQADWEKAKDDVIQKVREEFYNLQKSLIQIDSSVAKMRYQEKQNALLEYMLGLQETTAANLIEQLIEGAQNKFSFIQAVTDYDLAVAGLGTAIGDPDYFEPKS